MAVQAVRFAVRFFGAISVMSATVLSVSLTSTSTASAGEFFDEHDSLFRNEELCAGPIFRNKFKTSDDLWRFTKH